MAIPFRDTLRPRSIPWVTFGLIIVNLVVFLLVQPSAFQTAPEPFEPGGVERMIAAEDFAMRWGLVPCEVVTGEPIASRPDGCDPPRVRRPPTDAPTRLPLVTSMFLHGDITHLAGNLFYLWVFGRNVEDRLGPLVHLGHYLLGGLAAGLTAVLVATGSSIPVIGASGAIAASMGAYLVCHPRARILTMTALPLQIVRLPSIVVLALYFVTQFFIGSESNIAWEAHAGGMLAGAALALLALRLPGVDRRARDEDPAEALTTSF